MGTARVKFDQKSDTATGALSFVISRANQVANICVNIDALPTTSENLTVTLNANAGSSHLLYSVDPSVSTGSTWDLVLDYDDSFALAEGDTVTVAYANTDANTIDVIANVVSY